MDNQRGKRTIDLWLSISIEQYIQQLPKFDSANAILEETTEIVDGYENYITGEIIYIMGFDPNVGMDEKGLVFGFVRYDSSSLFEWGSIDIEYLSSRYCTIESRHFLPNVLFPMRRIFSKGRRTLKWIDNNVFQSGPNKLCDCI